MLNITDDLIGSTIKVWIAPTDVLIHKLVVSIRDNNIINFDDGTSIHLNINTNTWMFFYSDTESGLYCEPFESIMEN